MESIPEVAVTLEGTLYMECDRYIYTKSYSSTTASVFNLMNKDDSNYVRQELLTLHRSKGVVFLTHQQFSDILKLVFEACSTTGEDVK